MRSSPTNDHDDERRAELDAVYRKYATSDTVKSRWSPENPGNAAIVRELSGARDGALHEWFDTVIPRAVVDVGCGSGSTLPDLLRRSRALVGVELLSDRLEEAAASPTHFAYVQADGTSLPIADRSVDVVVLSTVLSSIRNAQVRKRLADEVNRVLTPRGVVLWYDFRYPNPLNRHTTHISRRELRRLFPQYELRLRSITVVPQLARRLGTRTDQLYRLLARVPALRSHLVGILVPHAETPPAGDAVEPSVNG